MRWCGDGNGERGLSVFPHKCPEMAVAARRAVICAFCVRDDRKFEETWLHHAISLVLAACGGGFVDGRKWVGRI